MRYTLRNQDKIEEAFPGYLQRIIDSLDVYFKDREEIELHEFEDEPRYKAIIINDTGHSTNMIVLYVIKQVFDVYHLAFREVVG